MRFVSRKRANFINKNGRFINFASPRRISPLAYIILLADSYLHTYLPTTGLRQRNKQETKIGICFHLSSQDAITYAKYAKILEICKQISENLVNKSGNKKQLSHMRHSQSMPIHCLRGHLVCVYAKRAASLAVLRQTVGAAEVEPEAEKRS